MSDLDKTELWAKIIVFCLIFGGAIVLSVLTVIFDWDIP
jgi:hypothetical protein